MTLVELELLLMWLHSELGLGPGRNNTLKFEGTSGKEGLSQTQNWPQGTGHVCDNYDSYN